MPAWSDYQEKTADFFRSLGLEANTNMTLQGVRTSHDVDVVVRSNHVGFDLLWLIECKHWQSRVSKLHVLGLREIVSDLGADRGILMAEAGFQNGAFEAAQLTNVQLTSLSELSITASEALGMAKLRSIQERMYNCRDRYWALSKEVRLKYSLRAVDYGYNGDVITKAIEFVLGRAFRGLFPVVYHDTLSALGIHDEPVGSNLHLGDYDVAVAQNPIQLSALLEPKLAELERLLDVAEAAQRSGG